MKHDENGNTLLSTSEISSLLGFSVSVNLLKRIGAEPRIELVRAVYWLESDFQKICLLLSGHILNTRGNRDRG